MKIKKTMEKLGYSPRKEFQKLSIICLLIIIIGFASFLILKNYMYIIFGVILSFVFSLTFLNKYQNEYNSLSSNNLEDFSVLFSYFRIYIHNGYSVYTALKEILIFANCSLRKLLEKLIDDIDEDKTVQPFISFAKEFDDSIVEEMMISIFQMIDDGEQSDYLKQFEMIFDKFSENLYEKKLQRKDSTLGTFGSAPLVGSCYLIIVLTIGIVSVIGELVNGI